MATADILTLVQSAPDISTNNATWVNTLIEKAKAQIELFCNLPAFPVHSQSTSVSGASATENISGLAENTLWVSLNGDTAQEITLTLASCTTGTTTAAQLQTQLRAVDDENEGTDFQWVAITATWNATTTKYTVTNPAYGEGYSIGILFDAAEYHVAQAMKLGPVFGGVETAGTDRDQALEHVCAQMVIDAYRAVMLSPEGYEEDTSKATLIASAFEKAINVNKQMLLPRRRLTF